MSTLSICKALVQKSDVSSSLKNSMKVFALMLAAAPLTAFVHAQGAPDREQVNVPFGFEVGAKHLAAGVYTVETEMGGIISVRGTRQGALVLSRNDQGAATPLQGKLVFRKHGSRYFLREIWMADSSTHFRCLKSKAEEEEVMLADRAASTNVEVAALDVR